MAETEGDVLVPIAVSVEHLHDDLSPAEFLQLVARAGLAIGFTLPAMGGMLATILDSKKDSELHGAN